MSARQSHSVDATKRQGNKATSYRSNILPACAFAALVLIGVGSVSTYSLLVVLLDGGAALLVLAPLCLGGWALLPAIRANRLPIRWQLLLAAVSGIGIGANLVLILGLFGCLSRPLWLALLILAAVVGLARIRSERAVGQGGEKVHAAAARAGAWRFLLLLIVPFAVTALLSASSAPGVFWSEEGFGYDVLEYHLELPKEYFHAGRIAYAPHNVYANFPTNVEMLYLLEMIVLDDVRDVGTVAQITHLFFGVLTIFAAWVIASGWSPRAGVMVAVILGTCGWLVYLSALAYDDNGVLFFGVVSIGALLRARRAWEVAETGSRASSETAEAHLSYRGWLIICGVSVGLACGCKYTAVAFVALPVIALSSFIGRNAWNFRAQYLALTAAGAFVAFAPWLVKNIAFTGNPVFPLANSIFHAQPPGFGPEETKRWDSGHEPSPSECGAAARLRAAWGRIVNDPEQRFGPVIFILAALGVWCGKCDRGNILLIAILAIQFVVWVFATHLFARFATPLLLPMILLAGNASGIFEPRRRAWLTAFILVTGAAYNLYFIGRLYARERGELTDAPASLFYDGKLPGFEYLGFINRELPANALILMVGDSRAFYVQPRVDYCVVFNECPFARNVREAESPGEIVQWIRDRGYTHVLVNWAEVARLRATYGFPSDVNESLFDRLRESGLRLVRSFSGPAQGRRYIEVYEVHSSQ